MVVGSAEGLMVGIKSEDGGKSMRSALSHRISREMDGCDLIGAEMERLAISDRRNGAIRR